MAGATVRCVRTGFRLILDEAADIEVVGEAGDGRQAIRRTEELQPDVVLMDVRMPVMDSIEATAKIRSHSRPETAAPRVIILTTFDFDEYVDAALRAGASGFLLKDALADDVLAAIRMIASGDAVLAPSATKRLIERYVGALNKPSRPVSSNIDALTPREQEVFLLVAAGLSNAEIATRLVSQRGHREGPRQPHPRETSSPPPRASGHPGPRRRASDPGNRR